MSTGSERRRRRRKTKRSMSLDPSTPRKQLILKPTKSHRPVMSKKKKNSRRRAISDAPLQPKISTSSLTSLKLDSTKKNQNRKKSKKSQTPRPTHSNKKKKPQQSSMTPKASLSFSATSPQGTVFSSDDELHGYFNEDTDSKTTKITNKNIKKEINIYFDEFRTALNKQQSKLLHDVHVDHIEQTEYEFIINKDAILSQINKYGYIRKRKTYTHTKNIYDDILNESKSDDTMAMKKKIILGEIQHKTMEKLDMIILMEKEAKEKSKQAEMLRQEVDEGLKYIRERRKIINDKIAIAAPELRKAKLAVSGIDPIDINEIKTLKSPPTVIEKVITATVMLLGHKIKQWRDVQKLLSYKFKPELMNFDTHTLSKSTREKVYKKYAGKDDFTFSRVYSGSKVCGNLVLWVISQINYSRMLDVIIPYEKEVKKLKKKSEKKEKLMKELIRIVKELEDNIELYTNECDQMIDHIIQSTDDELKQFSDKLQPLNEKFNHLLSKCM